MRDYPEWFKSRNAKGKRQKFLLFMFYFSLFLAAWSLGCRPKPPTEADANAPSDSVAVTVNGVDITESDVQALVNSEVEKIATKAAQLPPEFIEQYKKQLRQWALETLIKERLLDEQVKQAKIVVAEEEVVAQIMSAASTQKPPLSLEEFEKKFEKYGQSFDQLKQQVRKELSYQKFMAGQWAGKINVTEDEARNYYSENQTEFEIPEQVRASHILIKPDTSEPGTDPNEAKARAKAQAEDLLKQIKEGADFAELAKANSACLSAANGGDLDFFPRGEMEAPFDKAAFGLKLGQVSDVVETRYGYHIIRVTDHKDPSVIPFEQAKTYIIAELTQNKQVEFTKAYIESLKAEADIIYPESKEPRP